MDKKKICRRSNFATTSSSSKSVKNNSSTNDNKRDPLTEITNSLIPTEFLLGLCSNSISAQDLLLRSQTSTLPVFKNLLNSKSDSKSDTSIGSSNFNYFRDAQNPTPVPSHVSNSSSASLGNEGRKLTAYSRRRTSENLEGPRKFDPDLASSTPVKKNTKDDGKVLPVHLNTNLTCKKKDKLAAVTVPLDLIQSEKERAEEKGVSVPLSSTSIEEVKDKGNTTIGSRSCTPVEKPKGKGKSIAVPFSSTTEKRKAVAASISHHEQAEDKEKSTAMLINHPLNKVRRNIRAAISSCPPLRRRKSIRDKHIEADDVKPTKAWSDPHPKNKKTRYSAQPRVSDYSLSHEFEKQKAYFHEIDAFELPVEEVSGSDLD